MSDLKKLKDEKKILELRLFLLQSVLDEVVANLMDILDEKEIKEFARRIDEARTVQ
jgi:hypothetical protein